MTKDMIVAYFKVRSQNLSRGINENHENRRIIFSMPGVGHMDSKIRRKRTNYYIPEVDTSV
jgi:hypothetical protein